MPGVRRPDLVESGVKRPEGLNTMLWMLIIPVLAVILLFVYVLGYRYGLKVAERAARYREEAIRESREEAIRERRYCGTAQASVALFARQLRQYEESIAMRRRQDDEGERCTDESDCQ